MNLLDLLNSPWALEPNKLAEIQAIYRAHANGEKIDIEAIEARLGRPLNNTQSNYEVLSGGVAVIGIDGVLAPKANLFMQISGGTSTQIASSQLQAAIDDPSVRSVILRIDSPGGSVFGTPEMAQVVRQCALKKPVVALSDATLCSAAYWIGSAANAVFITGNTVQVGSIGVVATHVYAPDKHATTTHITAGKYKRIANEDAPLSKEGQEYLQAQVDHIYSVFVDDVAANRRVSADEVLSHMADGRVFIGQQAIDCGLVDGVMPLSELAAQLASNPSAFATRRKAVFKGRTDHKKPSNAAATNPSTSKGENHMDKETLQKEHPQLFAQLQSEFSAQGEQAGLQKGATAERERIQNVRAQSMPGHEALIETLAFDGKTTPEQAAVAVIAAQRALNAQQKQKLDADAPAPVATQVAPSDAPLSRQSQADQAVKLAKEKGISVEAALKELGFSI